MGVPKAEAAPVGFAVEDALAALDEVAATELLDVTGAVPVEEAAPVVEVTGVGPSAVGANVEVLDIPAKVKTPENDWKGILGVTVVSIPAID